MRLSLNAGLAKSYTSSSQKARIITEDWVLHQTYCPNCGGTLNDYKNNAPVADFYCKNCSEDFELKSKKGKIGRKVSASGYDKMIERISSPTKPNFFFLGYLKTLSVNDFFIVPKHFFVPEIIEKRKPLTTNARRAGWVGCNILFSKIPKAGQIFYIEDSKEIPKIEVLKKWQKTVFLKKIKKVEEKGWILDIMNCIDTLNKKEFSLADLYTYEDDLRLLHPENKNIRPKIRQQLQLLRDKKYLEFKGRGTYVLK